MGSEYKKLEKNIFSLCENELKQFKYQLKRNRLTYSEFFELLQETYYDERILEEEKEKSLVESYEILQSIFAEKNGLFLNLTNNHGNPSWSVSGLIFIGE
jgi:hypothetical protein